MRPSTGKAPLYLPLLPQGLHQPLKAGDPRQLPTAQEEDQPLFFFLPGALRPASWSQEALSRVGGGGRADSQVPQRDACAGCRPGPTVRQSREPALLGGPLPDKTPVTEACKQTCIHCHTERPCAAQGSLPPEGSHRRGWRGCVGGRGLPTTSQLCASRADTHLRTPLALWTPRVLLGLGGLGCRLALRKKNPSSPPRS